MSFGTWLQLWLTSGVWPWSVTQSFGNSVHSPAKWESGVRLFIPKLYWSWESPQLLFKNGPISDLLITIQVEGRQGRVGKEQRPEIHNCNRFPRSFWCAAQDPPYAVLLLALRELMGTVHMEQNMIGASESWATQHPCGSWVLQRVVAKHDTPRC